jgi:outer membrane protein TolC
MYIADTILLGFPLNLNRLEFETKEYNTALIASRLGMEQTTADLKIARSARFPVLNFSTGYSYNRSETPSSISTFSQSSGFNYGFDISIPIFNGFQVNRNIKNTKIELENQKLSYEETELQLMSDLHMLYNTYSNSLMMVDFENQNMEVTLFNLELALERYELGALSGLDFLEFQLSYLNAMDRLLSAMYQAKANELSLLVISGQMEEFLERIVGKYPDYGSSDLGFRLVLP